MACGTCTLIPKESLSRFLADHDVLLDRRRIAGRGVVRESCPGKIASGSRRMSEGGGSDQERPIRGVARGGGREERLSGKCCGRRKTGEAT